MAINEYLPGQKVRISASFTNSAGTEADPSDVILTVKAPTGVTSTPTVSRDSTGIYHADVTLNSAGQWHYRWTGSGVIVAAGETFLIVNESEVV